MTTAPARAVPQFFSAFRVALSAATAVALVAPAATAAPNCTGTGGPDTCVISLANINTETVDAVGQTTGVDLLQFNDAVNVLSLNANTIGTTLGAPVRFANFEAAQVVAGTTLNLTGAVAVSPATPTMSLTWTIDGTLNVAGGDAIGDLSAVTVNAGGVLGVNETETIGALAGAGSIVIASNKVLSANGSTATTAGDVTGTTFSGVISGAGGFTKTGLGMLKLTNANTFTGPLAVSLGTLEINNANAISSASSVTIATGGELTAKNTPTYNIGSIVTPANVTLTGGRITGNPIINGNVSSNGGIQPGNTSIPTFPGTPVIGNPGQDMGQVRINGNYASTGAGAYLGSFINIDLAAPAGGTPGTTHDFLDIAGNVTSTGGNKTRFSVASFLQNPTGFATTGNGIQVVRITGTSTNAGNDFFQGNALVAGPYQYVLKYVANYNIAGDDGYFLQSAARDELVVQPALLSAGQDLIRQCFRDEQRVPDSPKGATYGRAWFGYRQGNTSFGPNTGTDMNHDFSCATGGMDWRMGAGWFGGVSGGFGTSNADLTLPSGVATLGGDSRVVEAYAAFTSSAFFLNLSGGYANTTWTYNGKLSAGQASSGGLIGQAQAGVALGLEPLAVKLIGALNYDGVNCGSGCFTGVKVDESTGLVEARGTVRLDGVTWGGSIRPWASASYSKTISDGINKVSMNGVSVATDTNDDLLLIDAGLQAYLDENMALYADGGYHEALNKDISGYRAGIGLKLYW